MEVREVENARFSHVELSGRLDIEGVGEVEAKFLGLTASRRRPSLVDLSKVGFMGSLGIGMLFGAAKALARHGAKMVLLNPTEFVERTLLAANVAAAIPIAHSLEEAERVLSSL